jgi:hypothetical protein
MAIGSGVHGIASTESTDDQEEIVKADGNAPKADPALGPHGEDL